MASSFNLSGRVILEGGSAIKTSEALAARLEALSRNGRTTAATLKTTAQAMELGARAARSEAQALSTLTIAQQKSNAVQRESLANAGRIRAQTGAIQSGAAGKAGIAEGQRQLALNRALTETVRQRIAVEDAEGRAAARASQIGATAARTRIAQERLLLAQQKEAARAQEAAVRTTSLTGERAATSIGRLGSASLHTATITGAAFVGLAANAIVMERQFANVVRTSDILDSNLSKAGKNKAIKSLSLQFDALAQTLPVSYKELTDIGAAANQLGVSNKNLSSFTKTVAQFSATTGVSVDTAATAFGRLDSLIPDVKQNYLGLADAINKVGVNSVATDQQIISIASQISGVAASAGLGYKAIIGFSGALASVAVSPFLARGLSTRLFQNLNNAVSDGGDQLIKFAQVSGMSAKQFKAAWEGTQSQKEGALTALFNGIRIAGPDAVNVLKNLGVNSVLDQAALIKLANAADSTGKSGALLAQTFRDANTAAGENAKQYAVIANTVQSKLQVALNRVRILFRNVADSNLGPLGAAIDGISGSVLKLSQGLDQPFKLLGAIKLPFTNGQLLGFGTLALGAVAGFTLLVGVLAKVVSSFLHVGQGITAVRGFFASSSASAAAYATEAGRAAAANEVLAASNRQVAATRAGALLASNKVTAANSAFGSASIASNVLANANNRIMTSNNRVVSSFRNLASRGASAFRTVAGGARALGGAISSTLLGPVGLIAGALVLGLVAADKAMRDIGSTAGDLSVNITKASNAAQILSSTKVSGATDGIAALWDKSTHKFLSTTAQFKASAASLGNGGILDDFAHKFTSIFSEGSLNKGFNYTTLGLDKIDAGFKNLSDSGNTDAAVAGIQKFLAPLNDSERSQVLAHMGEATAILGTQLNKAGLSAGKNGENIQKLAKSNDILLSTMSKTEKAAAAQADSLNALSENAQDYITQTKKAAEASIDLNTAFQNAGKNASFGDFLKSAQKQFSDFTNQTKNITKIAAKIGPQYIKQLSQLDPGILALAVKTKGGMDKLQKELDRPQLLDAFRDNFGKIQSDPGILSAFQAVGAKGQQTITDSLAKGKSVEDAFRALGQKGVDAYNAGVKGTKTPAIKLKVDDGDLQNQLANISVKGAKDLQVKITGDAGPAIRTGEGAAEIINNLKTYIKINADSVIAQKKGEDTASYIGRLKSTLTVLGDTAPAEAKGKSAAYQIGLLQAQILVDADPSSAKRTAAQTAAVINKLKGQITINGDAAPAQAKGESTKAYISKLIAKLTIAADPNPANRTAAGAKNAISRLKGIITILGNKAPAQKTGEGTKAYIDRLKGTIAILGNPSSAKARVAEAVAAANRGKGTITVGANTASALAAINALMRPRTAPLYLKPITLAGAGSGNGSFLLKNANGGPIKGPGTGTSDSIMSLLSNGEYVVRAKQAKKYGPLLHAINNGLQGYASGGTVAPSTKYQGTPAAINAPSQRQAEKKSSVFQITELSTFDRHLLQTIADNIGVTIAPDHIAAATTGTVTAQAPRGNG